MRRRRAWLWSGTGRRTVNGRTLPGYYVRFYDYASGARINRSKHFQALRSAQSWVAEFNARADLRLIGQTIPLSIMDAAREFLDGCAALAKATRTAYRTALAELIAQVGRDTPVSSISGSDVDRFIARRLDVCGSATVSKDLAGIRRFFNWAAKRGYAAENPVASATARPKRPAARVRPQITEAQLQAIADQLEGDRLLAFQLGLTTGLDRGIIERLTPEQLDLDAQAIRYRRVKTNKVGVVPIHADLVSRLAKRIVRARRDRPFLRGLARQQSAGDWWHQACDAAGVPGLLFRDLRALATTRLCRQPGVTLAHAQHLLGHASPETTARHYLTFDPGLRQSLDSLSLPGHPAAAGASKRKRAPAGRRAAKQSPNAPRRSVPQPRAD